LILIRSKLLTSHFTDANNMASTSCNTQKMTKPKPWPMPQVRKEEVTKEEKGEWMTCVRGKKTDIFTGQKEDTPTALRGELHQWIYSGWWECGTDVRQEGTGSMERNEGGEDEVVYVHTATKRMKSMKGKEQVREEMGKGGRKGDKGEEEEDEGVMKGDRVGASTTIDPMDMLCNNMIFGNCWVNLFDPRAH